MIKGDHDLEEERKDRKKRLLLQVIGDVLVEFHALFVRDLGLRERRHRWRGSSNQAEKCTEID